MFKNAAPLSGKVFNAASSHRQRQKGKDQRDKRELNSLTTTDPFLTPQGSIQKDKALVICGLLVICISPLCWTECKFPTHKPRRNSQYIAKLIHNNMEKVLGFIGL